MNKENINSINRLNNIMNEIIKTQNNISIRDMWINIFKLKNNEDIKLLRLLADVIELVDSIIKDVSQMENINQNIYLDPLQKIKAAFSIPNMSLPVETLKSVLGNNIIVSFAFCVDVISRDEGSIDINSEDIENIKKDVDILIDEILKSEIESELKKIFLISLQNIRDSIEYYKINGIEGLEKSMENCLGSIILHRDIIQKNNQNNTANKIGNILSKIFEIVKLANLTLAIGEPIFKQFLGK